MEKYCKTLLVLMVLAIPLISGCNKAESDKEILNFQDRVHVEYKIDEIEGKETAKCYKVDYYEADEELLLENLLQNSEVKRVPYAYALGYIVGASSDPKEWLYIYDGGKAFGTDEGVLGGFGYSRRLQGPDIFYYQDLVPIHAEHPDLVEQDNGSNLRTDFDTDIDLSFMPVKQAKELLCELQSKCRTPEFRIDTCYALDYKTLQKHQDIRNEYAENYIWKEDDEAYLLQGSEVVDDIPVMNHSWTHDSSLNIPGEWTEINALINKEGIIDIDIRNAMTITKELQECKLISAKKAEQLLAKELSQMILMSDIHLENLELRYVCQRGEDEIQMIPAWVFCVSIDSTTTSMEKNKVIPIKEYNHYVYNAITGEKIQSGGI